MWAWILPYYLCFTLLAGIAALLVALFVPENQPDRRKTAFRIVKLFFGASSGLTLLVSAASHLSQSGLL